MIDEIALNERQRKILWHRNASYVSDLYILNLDFTLEEMAVIVGDGEPHCNSYNVFIENLQNYNGNTTNAIAK